ncbi:hypothetical protein Cme02nite_00300 [Catellatospora methionotrophica]|uniref:YncI copper-binding domain-containing protein n=1 Tax=Catellatospora methionotrophica TaxID=121620 RepID=A0A8J3L4L8_9ACTN|nr:DUF1775 domain-containing protein [Catellatospora methionotrophica]GIG11698.1 hypothetical protein Cme02nite_00300 [Catellatospora methionotrophica]
MTRLVRAATALAAALAAVLLTAAPAAAHVELVQAKANGDGTTTLTFAFNHGCDEAPTTELVVALPQGVTATTATSPVKGWTGTVSGDRVTFTGPPVPTKTDAQYLLTTRITGKVGQTFVFPAIQTCTGGATSAWIDQSADAEHPAPRMVATATMLAAQPTPPAAAPAAAPPPSGGATLPQAAVALTVFVLLAAGAAAFVASRRQRTAPTPSQ